MSGFRRFGLFQSISPAYSEIQLPCQTETSRFYLPLRQLDCCVENSPRVAHSFAGQGEEVKQCHSLRLRAARAARASRLSVPVAGSGMLPTISLPKAASWLAAMALSYMSDNWDRLPPAALVE